MNNKALIVPALILAAAVVVLLGQTYTYVGVEKCRGCHRTDSQGRQYPIWEASLHSRSFVNLDTPQGQAGDPKCLKCHAPLAEKAPELQAEGVTCETCHGPGSEYKKLSLMQNPDEARKNGMASFPDEAAVKAMCLACHDKAHNRPFDFNAAWDKIKHPVPDRE